MVSLRISQKKEIIKDHKLRVEQGRIFKQSDLCPWAQSKFNLKKPPNQSTISRIIKDAYRILTDKISQSIKSRKASHHPAVEEALVTWLADQAARGRQISVPILREYGILLVKEANNNLSADKQIQFHFSNGWYCRFNQRHVLELRRFFGESGSADISTIQAALPSLREEMSLYSPDDVWNAD